MSKVSDLRAALKKSRPALTVQKDDKATKRRSNKTTKQQSNRTMKQQNDEMTKQQNNNPPKQMTVFIDADLYEAMLLAKAHGAGSLKQQINQALRKSLKP